MLALDITGLLAIMAFFAWVVLVGAEDASDMNWDIDMCPIAVYAFETEGSENS